MRIRTIAVFLLMIPICSSIGFPRHLTQTKAHEFIDALVSRDPRLPSFVQSDELKLSNRLGTTYEGIDFKFLVGYDIDPSIRRGIESNHLTYTVRIDSLDGECDLMTASVASKDYSRSFYFRDGLMVSPVSYHTRHWHRVTTDHLIFVVDDTSSFNQYSARRLEKFVGSMADLLEFTYSQRSRLAAEKILYVLCRDENEIERVCGFKTLGMFVLAYDCVVTTYNCHYHEILHLLMNFKLGTLPLYTHPFLQEGFAVAFGGRGGKEPRVILELGHFLQRSGMLDYKALLRRDEFLQQDASFSYPLAGLYNLFLVKTVGINSYVDLYRKYSVNEAGLSGMSVAHKDLPDSSKWMSYLDGMDTSGTIFFDERSRRGRFFQVRDSLALAIDDSLDGVPHWVRKYRITATENEIRVANLLSRNLIADYAASLSWPPQAIPKRDGAFQFYVDESVFDEPVQGLIIQ